MVEGIIIGLLTGMMVMGFFMKRQTREIDEFVDQLEDNLDSILAGRPIENLGAMQDVLVGKISEKLCQVERIWRQREYKSLEDKKMMKELISDISHQIKTPLANQKIYSEILEQEELSEKGKECLQHMERQTDRLTFLFQHMIKMSRLEVGVVKIQKKRENLIRTLEQAVESMVPIATKKDLDIFVDYGSNIVLSHDTKWTEEAIFNILDNAVKYTKAGGSIQVTITQQEVFTKISIKDSGKGISPERQAQIFKRFYREPEVHNEDGHGIGLYIARKIIELQQGYIELDSQAGVGSEFMIYLPN